MRQMTKEEASQHYLIPMDILDEYESWGLCSTVKQVMCQWQYDDQDLERPTYTELASLYFQQLYFSGKNPLSWIESWQTLPPLFFD